MNIYEREQIQRCVADIFTEAGFEVREEVPLKIRSGREHIDFIAEQNEKRYCVEVKCSQDSFAINHAAMRICEISSRIQATPILVVAGKLGEKREYYEKEFENLTILDISNLLYAVKYHEQLRNRLISLLPYSVEDIEPQESFLRIDTLQHADYIQSLIEELRACLAGRKMAREFETLCTELLKNIFADDLALWEGQRKSNNGLYRFDLLCRIKDGKISSFWHILESFFGSKYVIFEYKNHKAQITQKEVYTTERYLYAKALRGVAIIIAANGYDENSLWAAKGCLRENGKLILLLDVEDIIKMSEMKQNHDDPADHLLEKLDTLLMNLEK